MRPSLQMEWQDRTNCAVNLTRCVAFRLLTLVFTTRNKQRRIGVQRTGTEHTVHSRVLERQRSVCQWAVQQLQQ